MTTRNCASLAVLLLHHSSLLVFANQVARQAILMLADLSGSARLHALLPQMVQQ